MRRRDSSSGTVDSVRCVVLHSYRPTPLSLIVTTRWPCIEMAFLLEDVIEIIIILYIYSNSPNQRLNTPQCCIHIDLRMKDLSQYNPKWTFKLTPPYEHAPGQRRISSGPNSAHWYSPGNAGSSDGSKARPFAGDRGQSQQVPE